MLFFSLEYNCFSGWGSKLLLIIALKLYPTTGCVPLSLSSLSNSVVCTHGLMGMISSHKMHMTKAAHASQMLCSIYTKLPECS